MRIILTLALAFPPLMLVACGGSAHSRHLSKADFGARWPLTVSEGTFRCSGADEVTFKTPSGETYAVNAMASNDRAAHADCLSKNGERSHAFRDAAMTRPLRQRA
jgi:hypothetical protein